MEKSRVANAAITAGTGCANHPVAEREALVHHAAQQHGGGPPIIQTLKARSGSGTPSVHRRTGSRASTVAFTLGRGRRGWTGGKKDEEDAEDDGHATDDERWPPPDRPQVANIFGRPRTS